MKTDTKRRLFKIGGITLILFSVFMVIGWFFFLMPYRQNFEISWMKEHADRLLWDSTQKSIKRIGWQHDDCFVVGRWGDEYWVAWIIERMKPGDDISSCFAGHKDAALKMMTNQDIGASAEKWIAWWEANKHKKQAQWIAEGFEKMGLTLHKPLNEKNVIELLRILGKDNNSREVVLNAFRWLRDSDFTENSFSYEDIPSDKPDEVFAGLKKYCSWNALWPKNTSPHVLSLGTERPGAGIQKPGICSISMRIGAWSLMIVGFAGGVFFLYRTRRLKC